MKIADFGLTRDIQERGIYDCDVKERELPWKWLALESIKKGQFTHKSDMVRFFLTPRMSGL